MQNVVCMWQTLILAYWQPLFAHLPVESLIHKHQAVYYQAINESTQQIDCAPFIRFMLKTILRAMQEQDTPHVDPQSYPSSQGFVAGLLELKYHNVNDAAAEPGQPKNIREVFVGFQKYLYQESMDGGA